MIQEIVAEADLRGVVSIVSIVYPADHSMTPGVSTRTMPKIQVAIMAGFMICLNRRYSMILKRSLSALPGRNSQ